MTAALAEPKNPLEIDLYGWAAAGIREDVANAAKNVVIAKMAKCERGYTVTTVRFLPTTKSPLEDPARFEILANISVDTGVTDPKFGVVPSKILQAVVSILQKRSGQKLDAVKIIH
jgi:hypothetical protein